MRSLKRRIRNLDIKRRLRWWMQRRIRGFDDTVTWSLDWHIAQYILPRLKLFRDKTNGYPTDFDSLEKWQECIDKMIFSMQAYSDGLWEHYGEPKDYFDRVEEGILLFGKYFGHLWW